MYLLHNNCLFYPQSILAKASDSYFPELNVEHPELRLFDHSVSIIKIPLIMLLYSEVEK